MDTKKQQLKALDGLSFYLGQDINPVFLKQHQPHYLPHIAMSVYHLCSINSQENTRPSRGLILIQILHCSKHEYSRHREDVSQRSAMVDEPEKH